jgi:hypothetical protein
LQRLSSDAALQNPSMILRIITAVSRGMLPKAMYMKTDIWSQEPLDILT